MAGFWKHCASAIVMAQALLATLFVARAVAQDLYDRPVLAVDPGMHTANIWSLAVDPEGRFTITGGSDRTVRIWSAADGKLLQTIWIPVGPDPVGDIYAVAISPDGSTVAAGGWTERLLGGGAIYLFDRESGAMIRRIHLDAPEVPHFLTFSVDGRYLAATLAKSRGLRVFNRDKDWGEAFRDVYEGDGYGAAFAPDGRLATTTHGSNGTIRLYDSNFRLVGGPVKAPSGKFPSHVAFSPNGRLLAVGYADIPAVDLLDGRSLARVPGPSPTNLAPWPDGLAEVAWSRDGRTLFAAGTADTERNVLLAWDQAGLGKERRLSFCSPVTAAGLGVMPDGHILVASMGPCLGLMSPEGKTVWTVPSPLADFREQADTLRISADGKVVDFGFGDAANTRLRFDVGSLRLSGGALNDGQTFAPNHEGLEIADWRNGWSPTLGGHAISIEPYDMSRSLAVAQDGKHFFLGSAFALAAFDDAGAVKWRRPTRGEVRAVNASKDGRIVVAATSDGTIRWLRPDDGHELLALQVLANTTDWVLWTPEGFYEATPGAQDVLKWVANHGPDRPATTLSVSAIPKLHRPDALPLVLTTLETVRALGIADVTAARLSVQAAIHSEKPPGAVLHVLAIGIDHFGEKAGSLHLDYAVDDARDVAGALLESQKGGPGKASLYADVKLVVLRDEKADGIAILNAMNTMAQNMRASGSDQDVAVILFSSHGEMIEGQFYLIPYGFDASSTGAMEKSAVSADEFARKVQALAERGKVLLLLDACHSGAVGPGGSTAIEDASVLRNAVNRDNVTVLTSSTKDELSQELPAWKHGAFTQAFLDALNGAADPEGHGVISINKLADAMGEDLATLTKGKQHLGERLNFSSDVFVVNR
jgi:WD40 repeat protein